MYENKTDVDDVLFAHRPNLIDMSKVYRQTNQQNLEQAFSVAERELGVTRLLDPEGETALPEPSAHHQLCP